MVKGVKVFKEKERVELMEDGSREEKGIVLLLLSYL